MRMWALKAIMTTAVFTALTVVPAVQIGNHKAARIRANALQVWAPRRATVVSAGPIKFGKVPTGGRYDVNRSFRADVLQFWGTNGSKRIASANLPVEFVKGTKEWMVVNKQTGATWFHDDLANDSKNPRLHPSTRNAGDVMLALATIFSCLFCATSPFFFRWRQSNRPGTEHPTSGRILQHTRRWLLVVPAELRLRMEFRRRNKSEVPASHAYKSVRRMQESLRRMTPTEGVIAARRKANELLTRIEEEDNHRLREIEAILHSIDQDYQLKSEGREETEEKTG